MRLFSPSVRGLPPSFFIEVDYDFFPSISQQGLIGKPFNKNKNKKHFQENKDGMKKLLLLLETLNRSNFKHISVLSIS